MDFIKVIDQTVREIKREVNLKVLKIPEIEQKVLDATDDVPWGPHGTALAEIAQATKKFTECQMVMNILWTRLGETGKNWRLVYKALAVIEYLVSHGSERAVDDIIEHTFQISSLSSFEYVEPSGKDMGINVRKKAENIAALLNDKEKIQEARNKAAANRDKYFGLSSTGITYKSGSGSFSGSSFQSSDQYGNLSSTRGSDIYRDSYKDGDYDGEADKDTYGKSRHAGMNNNLRSSQKTSSAHSGIKDQKNISYGGSKASAKLNDSDKGNSVPPQHSSALSSNYGDLDDDFDPRGTSATKSTAGTSDQVNFFDDLMDAPSSVPAQVAPMNGNSSEPDLFADASFVSASPQVEKEFGSESQVDLFASQPAIPSAVAPAVDLFSAANPVVQPEPDNPKPAPTNANIVDPFAAVPLNNFDGSDLLGAFASSSDLASTETIKGLANDERTSTNSEPLPKKGAFQVKSGVWADSLSRGIIDLNISAPKKVSLSEVGVVGGLSDGVDEREKGPPTSFYMGRAMGTGSGLGRSGFTSSQSQTTGDDFFSNPGSQQYQFGGLNK